MRYRLTAFRWSFLLLLTTVLCANILSLAAQGIQRTSKLDASAAPTNGEVPLSRMILLLAPTAAQQKNLDALLSAQVTQGNASFHQWLTPAQFATRFANTEAEAATVSSWLHGQGLTVAPLPASRGWIEFSGTPAQVEHAFGVRVVPIPAGTEVQTRYQLVGSPHLPATVASLVTGVVSLDGVESTLAATVAPVISTTGLATSTLTPTSLAKRLQITALGVAGTSAEAGAGETIAIPTRSNVRTEDFAAFRKSFGLPDSSLAVTLSGDDPGRTDDEAATVAAASWAGVAAPGAQILLVAAASTNATDGVDLALAAIVDGALARTVSVGYTACESAMSASHRAFYASLYRQAAAQGMAVIAATGDSGAAACHLSSDGATISSGLGVNALASTPWNIAVGAATVDAATINASAKLAAWRSSKSNSTGAIYATGGGASRVYALPAWQSAKGIVATDSGSDLQYRSLPDVSLPTVNSQSGEGLAFCFDGDDASTSTNDCNQQSASGSAISAALFSGVAAALAEKYGPQGSIAPNLYALNRLQAKDASSSSAFEDITSGSAKLPCTLGTPDCSVSASTATSGEIGFDAAAGYDRASGLGSVHADALIQDWLTSEATGTASVVVEMTTLGGITYNPSKIIALSAKVLSGSGGSIPTGTVQFYDATNSANAGSPVTLASDGTASYSEQAQFSIGGHNIVAQYSGDTTYEAATSQPITLNIQPSATALVVVPSTTTPAGGSTITITGTVTASDPGDLPPGGSITINLDGISQGLARLATSGGVTSGSLNLTISAGGAHAVQGTYSGDVNYNNSTSPSVTITVSKSATVTSIAATPSTLTAGTPETLTATIAPVTSATGTTYSITGTVIFYDGTTQLGTATVSGNSAVLTGVALSTSAAHTITAVYSGDASYSASTSAALVLNPILLPVTVALTSSTPILAPGQAVTLTATVTPVATPALTAEQHPSGYVLFYAGTTLVGSQAPVLVGVADAGVASTFVSSLPAGAYVITAQYSGDTTYGAATSNALNLQVEDFSVACNSNSISMVQGTTATVSCAVAALGGLTGSIQAVCEEQNPPQNGAISCNFTPSILTGGGATTLTVVTSSATSAQSGAADPRLHHRGPGNWPAGGGVALALVGLLLSPIGRRAKWLRSSSKFVSVAFLLVGLAGAGLGCNSSSVSSGGGSSTATPLGVHTLKITAASYGGTVTVSHYAYLTVNVTPHD